MKIFRIANGGTLTTFRVTWIGPTAETSGAITVDGTGLDLFTTELKRLGYTFTQ